MTKFEVQESGCDRLHCNDTIGRCASCPNEPITVTLKRGEWAVVVGAAREFDTRVPRDQGDGGACLDTIEKACRA